MLQLILTKEEAKRLKLLQQEYATACNLIVPEVMNSRCWNRVSLNQSRIVYINSLIFWSKHYVK